MNQFERIGIEVERQWRRVSYDEARFPTIAISALRRAKIPARTSPADVLDWVLGDAALPAQHDVKSEFGDPPITVFRSSRFFIAVLFWNDGTTAIHEHGFSGAFQVLSGSSVHGVYSFKSDMRVSATFALGALKPKHIELLRRGDIRPIVAGQGLIHSLFHLDRPSTSIVIRTTQDADQPSQFEYQPPDVGYASFAEDERSKRRIEALGAMRALSERHYFRALAAQARTMELPLLFHALVRHYRDGDLDAMRPALAAARARYGKAVDRILAAVLEQRRAHWIIRLRRSARDPELRFFLAVMLNARSRRAVVSLLRERFPRKNPAALIITWLDAIAELPPSDARHDNALEIPYGDHSARIVELVLADRPFRAIVRALSRDFGDVAEQQADLRAIYRDLKAHPLLAAWWR